MPRNRKRASTGKSRKAPLRPCTYELGYVRQDLYACRKCTANAKGVLSGFCRGCRETCHADHPEEVIELYTKRSFRCDCGNTRAKNSCALLPNKDDLNVGNEACYSHNFEGRYCRCDREYDFRLEMVQCCMCEDWLHEECYKTDAAQRGAAEADPSALDVEYELTCKSCVKKLPVLGEYYELYNAWTKSKGAIVMGGREVCTRPKESNIAIKPGAIDYLWRPGFRLSLCRCNECLAMYKAVKVQYLIDRADFMTGGVQEDTTLLKATNDDEIISDVIQAEEAEKKSKERAMASRYLGERIPRKPLPSSASTRETSGGLTPGLRLGPNSSNVAAQLSHDEQAAIRMRINEFLRSTIETNGGSLNSDSLRGYLADLKADLLSSFEEKLAS